ncbi:MAG: class I SAM-dependent methyltransferase [Magnetococcales bacterium]|nr:class I SAM-dependent methyltransferase [Magnetococcales bacterium]
MNEDKVWLRYQNEFAVHYHEVFYEGNSLIRHIQNAGHRLVERPLTPGMKLGRVLEVGAGAGEHVPHVRHQYDEYVLTDVNTDILEQAQRRYASNSRLTFIPLDCRHMDVADHSFDRLISIYNLEHVPEPYRVLKEWTRVLKPGGIMSIAIPTEGGLAWNMGRYVTTRRTFMKKGFDWDYIVARDHVNSCTQLLAFIRHFFPDRSEFWYPTGVPFHHVNLIYAVNIRVP